MECPKRETTEAEHATSEIAPAQEDSKYPRGIPLFLNLLSIILATIVCGYVCGTCHAILLAIVFANIATGRKLRDDYYPGCNRQIQFTQRRWLVWCCLFIGFGIFTTLLRKTLSILPI